MIPKNRKPTHPGEILLEEFLKPLGMSQVELAKKMDVPLLGVLCDVPLPSSSF